jgi:dienelactone hydrolase
MKLTARRIAGGACILAVTGGALGVLFLGVVLSGASLPLVRLPAPSGAFAVGTIVSTLAGNGVQIWYPARRANGRNAPYRYGVAPRRWRDRLDAAFVATDACIGAAVAAGEFPVLLYVPSWGGVRSDNTAQAENVASHGYVVVAVDDLYPGQVMDLSTASAYDATLRWAGQKVGLEATAALRVLSAFESAANEPDSAFAGHLDRSRTGAFGFSFGGAVAAEAAARDPRVRAAVNLDGWIFGDAADHGVQHPFLVVSSSAADEFAAHAASRADYTYSDRLDRDNLRQIDDGFARYGGYYLTLSGTEHYNFSDVGVLPSVRHTEVGPLGGRRAAAIVAAYLVQFFDRYVSDRPAPLFDELRLGAGEDRSRASLDPAARLEVHHVRKSLRSVRIPNRSTAHRAARSGSSA